MSFYPLIIFLVINLFHREPYCFSRGSILVFLKETNSKRGSGPPVPSPLWIRPFWIAFPFNLHVGYYYTSLQNYKYTISVLSFIMYAASQLTGRGPTLRPNKKDSVFRVMGLKILGRVGTHIFFNCFFLPENLKKI